ncbi:MAG: 4-hydroxy-tetrahydrodipicolinate synthase [Deltaproteobacteria bacterium]|jgi:4-hydroxy-tetrahydrodipicolinate synthase|nr:4-hydroxy-tetrahydrodipicolinate synthase [Deltaproteobacteria bacterium]MBW2477553.1 4-hydroxy-tetrahydrodipicolinate synthase [Deltaproteobacteria bacterium]MBW2504747.1 4-hydroxy-tetrahydrodipicolinate synthase [Deltaproteobacteria bacterium]
MVSGSMVAIVTPFDNQGKFAEEAYRQLIEFQIENGTDVIVPCGTTGESATLDFEEHEYVIKVCIEQVNKRVPVIAGTGANSTSEAIHLSKNAKALGADGLLLVCPYYNKPSQEGIFQHYKKLAEEVALPQVLYNVPGRTGINMTAETTVRLADLANVVAIKEASGNLTQVSEILARAGDKIAVVSGDDFLTFPMMACGAKGVISVSANAVPKQVKTMVEAAQQGDYPRARKLHLELLEFHTAMFIESNPVPVKTTLELMGKIEAHVRLPLVGMADQTKQALIAVLKKYQLI